MKRMGFTQISAIGGLAWFGLLSAGCERSSHNEGMVRVVVVADAPGDGFAVPDAIREADRPMLEAELVPDAVRVTGATETIEYHAEVASRLPEGAAFAWSASIVDDRGTLITNVGSGEGPIGSAETKSTGPLLANLQDGFYALRIMVAAHSLNWEDVAEGVQYLRVKNQKMREMTPTDWYQASRASLAVKMREEGK
jgi:hypothetical protein